MYRREPVDQLSLWENGGARLTSAVRANLGARTHLGSSGELQGTICGNDCEARRSRLAVHHLVVADPWLATVEVRASVEVVVP